MSSTCLLLGKRIGKALQGLTYSRPSSCIGYFANCSAHHSSSPAPCKNVNRNDAFLSPSSSFHCYYVQTRSYAARKGKRDRMRREKAARKLQVVKKDLLPGIKKFAAKAQLSARERTDMYHETREPVDDVYSIYNNRRKIFPIAEVIEMHRELHHPTMLNLPDAPLCLAMELDMSLEKKTKFVDVFSGVVGNPYFFKDGKFRSVMAFCKNEKDQNDALAAGADMAGGSSLLKQVQNGEVIASDYSYIVAHPDILNELSAIRGILKKRHPNTAKGSIGLDMHALVSRFKMGIEYTAEKDPVTHNFGYVEVPLGPLSMPSEQLEANIGAVVTAVCTHRPARLGPFITIALLLCPPTKEKIAIDISKYTPNVEEVTRQKGDDDDEDDAKTQIAANK